MTPPMTIATVTGSPKIRLCTGPRSSVPAEADGALPSRLPGRTSQRWARCRAGGAIAWQETALPARSAQFRSRARR
jgi:hypothetical protein